MSDPIEELMAKVKAGKATDKNAVPEVKIVKKEKLFNNKYYRSVNIDLMAEEKVAEAKEAKIKAAAKKKEDDDADAVRQKEYQNMLRGMGFDVK